MAIHLHARNQEQACLFCFKNRNVTRLWMRENGLEKGKRERSHYTRSAQYIHKKEGKKFSVARKIPPAKIGTARLSSTLIGPPDTVPSDAILRPQTSSVVAPARAERVSRSLHLMYCQLVIRIDGASKCCSVRSDLVSVDFSRSSVPKEAHMS